MTSSVKECALRARSTHGVHHAIVEVNIIIGVVLGELVAHVVPLCDDAVIGLALSLIAHVVIVAFFVSILHRIFLYGRYTLYTKFQGIVGVNDFRLPIRLEELLQALLRFLRSFCFARI